MPKLTPEQIAAYAQNSNACPFCQSEEITAHLFNGSTQQVTCNDCGNIWSDEFAFTGIAGTPPVATAIPSGNYSVDLETIQYDDGLPPVGVLILSGHDKATALALSSMLDLNPYWREDDGDNGNAAPYLIKGWYEGPNHQMIYLLPSEIGDDTLEIL